MIRLYHRISKIKNKLDFYTPMAYTLNGGENGNYRDPYFY